jgi:hypothetical protein
VPVDPATFNGIDIGETNRQAAELQATAKSHGVSAVYDKLAGVSPDEARRFGGSYRPDRG